MPDVAELPRPSHLWKQLPQEQKQQAAIAFWHDEHAGVEHAEAIAAIAQRLKFRAKSVVSLPVERKAQYLATMPAVSELVAARLLVAFHLAHRRPMMASFLEALGIAHENGLIADEDMAPPSAERLRTALQVLKDAYSPSEVSLYLTTLMWQDPETWGGLAEAQAPAEA